MTEIHENLPPISPLFFTLFDGIIFGGIALGVIFVMWKIFDTPKMRKQTPKPFIPQIFSLSKEIQKLKKLQKSKDWKKFSLEATKVLKKILEKKLQKSFAFATGKELEEILKEKKALSELKNIHRFFALLDPIKFAQSSGKNEIAEEVLLLLNTIT